MVDLAPTLKPETPEWWLVQLAARLDARNRAIKVYEDYYAGDHPLKFATKKFEEAFGGLFKEFADDWTQLVIDVTEERLNVVGFRTEEAGRPSRDLWRWWQVNNFDAESQQTHLEALITGYGYVSVWFGPDDTPRMRPHRAAQTIVAHDAESGGRRAALRKWVDEWSGDELATVYLPDATYKYRRRMLGETGIVLPSGVAAPGWVRREVDGEKWPLPNPLGVVPVVELPNRPRLGAAAQSEIRKVIPLQDVVNKLMADMMVAAEFVSLPQRWATGIEIPTDADGKPDQEAARVFQAAFNRLWFANPPRDEHGNVLAGSDPKFGEFQAANLSNFVTGIEMVTQHIATQTRTPPHYFYLSGQFPSGDAIKSAETGLVAKVVRKHVSFGERWEECVRLAARVADSNVDVAGLASIETIWSDPESRTESEHMDAISKRQALGVPLEQLWEDAGYTPTQIARFRDMRRREALEQAAIGADIESLLDAGGPVGASMDADELAKRANAAGILIRSGFTAAAALDAVGLDPIEHTGLLPVTVQSDDPAVA